MPSMNTFPREQFRRIAQREGRHIYCWQSNWGGEMVWVYNTQPPPFGIRCVVVQPSPPTSAYLGMIMQSQREHYNDA